MIKRALVLPVALLTVLVTAFDAGAGGTPPGASHTDSLLSNAASTAGASALPGDPIQVACWSTVDWKKFAASHHFRSSIDGYINYDEMSIDLTTGRCDAIAVIEKTSGWPATVHGQLRLSNELQKLMTDAAWLRGADTKASAECYGLQLIRPVARVLGATSARAAKLSLLYWRYLYPKKSRQYSSSECHKGGQLDIGLVSARWP